MDNKNSIAALFDLDGVVFDTESQYTKFWGTQCRMYHPEILDLEHKIKGQTLVQIYDRYFSDVPEEQPKITARLNEFEKSMRFDYIDGFVDFINVLKEHFVKTAVVTSSNVDKMNSVYQQRPEFKSLFDTILTSEMFNKSKPDPECYLLGAKAFETEVDNCVVFEDSFNGLKSGRAAKMTVVGLSTTNSAELIQPLCDVVISDYRSFRYEEMMLLLEKRKLN
jgi:HAD superfamily hydrolase (TIGR01509 family)